ncbi:hypothetical protein EK546_09130 [Salmonella enterica]|nr:hypothetical protein [Salmonella enterica]
MTKEEFITRQLTMKRLLDIFGGMDGGCSFMDLRTFVEHCEGEAITRILAHMGKLLDVAEVATDVTIDDLPDWAKEHAKTLS